VSATAHPSVRKILVIDDNPVILKALFLAFKSKGHEMYAALDGPEAFSIARREKLDLIILDICFPPDVDQSGNTWDAFLIIDWLHRIGVGEELPIIVISGADPVEFKDRCLASGAVAFFSKPLDMPRLLDTIHEIFSRGANTARPRLAATFAR
jgi:CheY-like chemotaxis protein